MAGNRKWFSDLENRQENALEVNATAIGEIDLEAEWENPLAGLMGLIFQQVESRPDR